MIYEQTIKPYMNRCDWQINIVEEFAVIFDAHARREEDHHLLLAILLQEREEHEQTLLRWTHDVALLQTGHGGRLFVIVDAHVDGLLFQRQFGQGVDLLRLGGREKHRLTTFWKKRVKYYW